MDERDVLLKAASIVEEGWCQGRMHHFKGDQIAASCVFGAIDQADALLGLSLIDKAFTTLERSLGTNPIDWNDDPGRTKWEVADALRRAAE